MYKSTETSSNGIKGVELERWAVYKLEEIRPTLGLHRGKRQDMHIFLQVYTTNKSVLLSKSVPNFVTQEVYNQEHKSDSRVVRFLLQEVQRQQCMPLAFL